MKKFFTDNKKEILFYIIKQDHLGDDFKQYVEPEPSEYKVGLSSAKYMDSGIVSMFRPLRDTTLYFEIKNKALI